MKITVEMTENEYTQMTQNAVKAKKYNELIKELNSIIKYPEPFKDPFNREIGVGNPYIELTASELYQLVIKWYNTSYR